MVCVNMIFPRNFTHYELGNWKGAVDIPPVTLEKLEENLEAEQQQIFLRFLRKMLKWQPEKRESARELLDDPWLRST